MALDTRTLCAPRRRTRAGGAPIFLGDFGLEFLAPIAGAAITAGGSIGSAFIVADAQTSVARDANRTALALEASRERVELAGLQAATKQNEQDAAVASKAVSSGTWALLALALVALLVGDR